MVEVRLIAVSKPIDGEDPRALPLLAIKVSQGKVLDRGVEYYLKEYPRSKQEALSRWLKEAAKGFPSVLEHIVFTFYIDGISRVASHQLVRHRIASYTQESQRFTEERLIRCLECLTRLYFNSEFAPEDAERELLDLPAYCAWLKTLAAIVNFGDVFEELIEGIEECLEQCFCLEPTPQIYGETREALVMQALDGLARYAVVRFEYGEPMEVARYVLPQSVRTSLIMTVNLRELLHIACLRLSPRAQQETREVVSRMIGEASKVVPEIWSLIEAYCSAEH